LKQPPVGRISGVIRQHVEDEALLDGLAHTVQVEGLELAIRALPAEKLKRLRFGRSGEGEDRKVRQTSALFHFRQDGVVQFLLRSLRPGLLALGLFERAGCQYRL